MCIHAVQQLPVSRRLDPTEPGVITIGTIHGGTVGNVIPETVTMEGTIRSFHRKNTLHCSMTSWPTAVRVIEPLGGKAELTIHPATRPR